MTIVVAIGLSNVGLIFILLLRNFTLLGPGGMTKVLPSGHVFEEVTGESGEYLRKNYAIFTDGAIKIYPEEWFLPTTFQMFADQLYNFKARPDDVFINTFPKSGTHWVSDIVWNLLHNPKLDNPNATLPFDVRCPNFEDDMLFTVSGGPGFDPNEDPMKTFLELCPGKTLKDGMFFHLASLETPPRLLKNHLPLSLVAPDVPQKSKIIYVARNPKDMIVSAYHFLKLNIIFKFRGTLEEFVDDLILGRVPYGPYWEHLKSGWERRNQENFCFVFFEDLKENPLKEVKRFNHFLETKRTDDQIEKIVDHCSFSKMKERNKENSPVSYGDRFYESDVLEKEGGFFRKGRVGGWRNELSSEQSNKLDVWIKKNLEHFEEDFKYKHGCW